MTGGGSIDTRRVAGRRAVRYETLEAALADVEALVAAGPVRSLGNWTAAMNVAHVALGVEFDTDGYPPGLQRVPWHLKLLYRPMKRRLLTKGFGPGIRPSPKVAAVFAPDASVTMDAALDRFREAIGSARQRGLTQPSPLFGEMSPAEHEAFNGRHAELHFSFIVPA